MLPPDRNLATTLLASNQLLGESAEALSDSASVQSMAHDAIAQARSTRRRGRERSAALALTIDRLAALQSGDGPLRIWPEVDGNPRPKLDARTDHDGVRGRGVRRSNGSRGLEPLPPPDED
jgi:hypothetical protein